MKYDKLKPVKTLLQSHPGPKSPFLGFGGLLEGWSTKKGKRIRAPPCYCKDTSEMTFLQIKDEYS